jgi:hypothetical protein
VGALAGICRDHGPAMARMDSLDHPGVSQETMNALSEQFRSVLAPVLPAGIARERLEFAVELVFFALVGKVRPGRPFSSHAQMSWEKFLDELCRATTRCLTDGD